MENKVTKDLGVAAYLKTLGFEIQIKRVGSRGEFSYPEINTKDVNRYYSDTEKFLSFANNMRNIKAQIENAPKEE